MLWRVLQENGGKLPEDAIVCFANTGKECEETLEFVRDCSLNWGVEINWVEYRADNYAIVNYETASRQGEPYEAMIEKKKYLPNAVHRFCSHELKNKPISKFTGLDEEDTMIGVRFDEPIRIPKMRKRGFLLPLVDDSVSKSIVREFWKSSPFDLGLDEHGGDTQLGNCDLCFLKSFDSIYSSIRQTPSRAVWWATQEKKRGATFHKSRPCYAAMLDAAQKQSDAFGHDENHIACFCGD